LNKFADLSDQEYKQMLGFKPNLAKPYNYTTLSGDIPDSVNWVEKGFVTPIKDQGSCGSCWSFSTTGSIESAYWIKNGKQVELSEQQLIDCSLSYGNNGCSGGLVEYAYHYATEHGLETEDEYPYHAKNENCATSDKFMSNGVQLQSFVDVKRFDPNQLLQAAALGPVSIGVDASAMAIRMYHSGIIHHFCGTEIDHAVLLVGYGKDGNTPYWLVKNSWGSDWGENGYFRVYRDMFKNDEGICGVQ
jgi:C1A family cysteine protease